MKTELALFSLRAKNYCFWMNESHFCIPRTEITSATKSRVQCPTANNINHGHLESEHPPR